LRCGAQVYLEEENRLKGYFHETQAAQDAYEYSMPTPTSSKKGAEFRKHTLPSIKNLVRPKKREGQRSIADIVRRLRLASTKRFMS
jgi:hypothetical protein